MEWMQAAYEMAHCQALVIAEIMLRCHKGGGFGYEISTIVYEEGFHSMELC
jgi:hypothetical protein